MKGPWDEEVITYSLDRFGTAKARAADLDEDGQLEIAVSCESATGDKSGVFYLKQVDGKWSRTILAAQRLSMIVLSC